MKNSLEIVIKQVRLEGGFERGGRIRVAECLRQIVPDRWASLRKSSFTKCFCVYREGEGDVPMSGGGGGGGVTIYPVILGCWVGMLHNVISCRHVGILCNVSERIVK